jgi:hypothetical protein
MYLQVAKKDGKFLEQTSDYQLFKDSVQWNELIVGKVIRMLSKLQQTCGSQTILLFYLCCEIEFSRLL